MHRTLPAALLAGAIACFALAPLSAGAAEPATGTLGPPAMTRPGSLTELTYRGGPAFGGTVLQGTASAVCGDPNAAPAGVCDVFTLTLDIPQDYWTKNLRLVRGYLEATIDWSGESTEGPSDVDLIITTEDGTVVGSGETDNSSATGTGTTSETARVSLPARGGYRVVAAGIVGGVATYQGTVRLVLTAPDAINTFISQNVQFGASTFVSPVLFGAEPGLNADPSGGNRWWVDWPVSSRSHMGTVMRSSDGGDSFRQMVDANCPERRQPGCFTSGGGDTEIALAGDGTVYFANQESLANEAACVSLDHGMTWPDSRCHAVTSLDPTNDRQWLAAYDKDLAYLAASTSGGVGLVRTEDGGVNWNTVDAAPGPEAPGSSAPIAVDATGGPRDETLYMLTRAEGLTIAVSANRGATRTIWPRAGQEGTGPCMGCGADPLLIPWMSMDRAGNLYVVWSDSSDHAVWMTTMLASDPANAGDKLGSTWSKPVRVSIPPARSTVFSQVIAGDPGRIAIAFQGADAEDLSSDVPDTTPWKVYAAFTDDALCQWDSSCYGKGPELQQVEVSPRVNHFGQICVSGLGCTINGKNRDLLDFFDIGVDADGRVGVTWSDDNHGLTQPYVMFAKVANGPSLIARKGSFRTQLPMGSVKARRGDAVWPINSSGGRNFDTLDITQTALTLGTSALKVRLDLPDAGDLEPGIEAGHKIAGVLSSKHIKYVTMWHFKDDVYFVAADTTGAFDDEGKPDVDFYGGKVDANDAIPSPFTPDADFGAKLVRDFNVEGRIQGLDPDYIEITVPDLSLIGSPKAGDRLLSVQSFALVGPSDAYVTIYTLPDVIDATPPFDAVLGRTTPSRVAGNQSRKAPARKPPAGPLPSTGTSDGAILTGIALLIGSALTWRRVRRDSEPFRN